MEEKKQVIGARGAGIIFVVAIAAFLVISAISGEDTPKTNQTVTNTPKSANTATPQPRDERMIFAALEDQGLPVERIKRSENMLGLVAASSSNGFDNDGLYQVYMVNEFVLASVNHYRSNPLNAPTTLEILFYTDNSLSHGYRFSLERAGEYVDGEMTVEEFFNSTAKISPR
jgi:hypothetical protein